MSNTECVFGLIDQCEFPAEDPFELHENLFPGINSLSSATVSKLFEKSCYNSWLIFCFNGESTASIFYDSILERLNNGELDHYYKHLSPTDLQSFKENFEVIISDELRHRELFGAIIDKMEEKPGNYQPDYYNPTCQELVRSELSNWDRGTLFGFLADIVTGESYLITSFMSFYRYTKNPIKKQIFKEFIKEESKHLAHFTNFIKKAKINELDVLHFRTSFIMHALRRLKFEEQNFKLLLDKLVKDTEKKNNILINSYDTEFHHGFNKIFLKKIWHFYNIVFPTVTQEDLEQILEEYKTK